VIAVWREAFRKFKTRKGARASIEALLKRVQNGGRIGNINPLVDIYNSISLKYGLPCGGEDMDTFSGDLRLTTADGSEPFVPLEKRKIYRRMKEKSYIRMTPARCAGAGTGGSLRERS
jgi:DNA/RNA-binding domain of Phe-tRNA-synthetase-like protein